MFLIFTMSKDFFLNFVNLNDKYNFIFNVLVKTYMYNLTRKCTIHYNTYMAIKSEMNE